MSHSTGCWKHRNGLGPSSLDDIEGESRPYIKAIQYEQLSSGIKKVIQSFSTFGKSILPHFAQEETEKTKKQLFQGRETISKEKTKRGSLENDENLNTQEWKNQRENIDESRQDQNPMYSERSGCETQMQRDIRSLISQETRGNHRGLRNFSEREENQSSFNRIIDSNGDLRRREEERLREEADDLRRETNGRDEREMEVHDNRDTQADEAELEEEIENVSDEFIADDTRSRLVEGQTSIKNYFFKI